MNKVCCNVIRKSKVHIFLQRCKRCNTCNNISNAKDNEKMSVLSSLSKKRMKDKQSS